MEAYKEMAFDYFNDETPKGLTVAARAEGEKLAKKYFTTPPIDIEKLITQIFGFTLRKLELPENISGKVQMELKEITVNTRNSIVHQRFTLAHELGHIVLKHDERRWKEFGDLKEGTPDQPIEEEANAFASGLLMPSFLLKPFAIAKKTPKETALQFQVSEQAMWYSYKTYKLEKYLYR
jgi:Zn-dependent peptidase ImmA (M78 family)